MQTVSQSDPIHGGYDNSSPSGGVPSTVTVTLPAGSAPGSILGGYSDLAQATASPGPLGSPSVVTLWPTAQADAAALAAPTAAATAGSGLLPTLDSGFQNPAGAAPADATAPTTPTAAATDAATAVGSAQPGAASTSSCTSTLTPQPMLTAVSSPEPSSTETSSSLLTSTLLNVSSEAGSDSGNRLCATVTIKLWSRVGLNWE
ncbi:hypothetical protein CGGC5_v013892 [Colletotrichum fructicola Nara gc5]|uniref:Uncharacterized protein n=1 Tax=Colletotrichum fructicola (strain Nara gc5) TaxID=1213859 RepID=L2F9S9_COLFN|nr:hypothetical protein CGGC5_v013892 [Colletotrichum fructicola Nara gc5]KAF5493513.1 hypothetical protein CGCF413_v009613 [Colletotrichum fructicola]